MTTDGIKGLHVETRNYGATATFWASLGFKSSFETDHGSGQWVHPAGGPYVFISEQHDAELVIRPVLGVADSVAFAPERDGLRAGVHRPTLGRRRGPATRP